MCTEKRIRGLTVWQIRDGRAWHAGFSHQRLGNGSTGGWRQVRASGFGGGLMVRQMALLRALEHGWRWLSHGRNTNGNPLH